MCSCKFIQYCNIPITHVRTTTRIIMVMIKCVTVTHFHVDALYAFLKFFLNISETSHVQVQQ